MRKGALGSMASGSSGARVHPGAQGQSLDPEGGWRVTRRTEIVEPFASAHTPTMESVVSPSHALCSCALRSCQGFNSATFSGHSGVPLTALAHDSCSHASALEKGAPGVVLPCHSAIVSCIPVGVQVGFIRRTQTCASWTRATTPSNGKDLTI